MAFAPNAFAGQRMLSPYGYGTPMGMPYGAPMGMPQYGYAAPRSFGSPLGRRGGIGGFGGRRYAAPAQYAYAPRAFAAPVVVAAEGEAATDAEAEAEAGSGDAAPADSEAEPEAEAEPEERAANSILPLFLMSGDNGILGSSGATNNLLPLLALGDDKAKEFGLDTKTLLPKLLMQPGGLLGTPDSKVSSNIFRDLKRDILLGDNGLKGLTRDLVENYIVGPGKSSSPISLADILPQLLVQSEGGVSSLTSADFGGLF